MENDREAWELLLDGLEHVKCEWRRNETSGLFIAGALLRLELLCTVAGSDGDGERIALGLLYEVNDLLRLGIV